MRGQKKQNVKVEKKRSEAHIYDNLHSGTKKYSRSQISLFIIILLKYATLICKNASTKKCVDNINTFWGIINPTDILKWTTKNEKK